MIWTATRQDSANGVSGPCASRPECGSWAFQGARVEPDGAGTKEGGRAARALKCVLMKQPKILTTSRTSKPATSSRREKKSRERKTSPQRHSPPLQPILRSAHFNRNSRLLPPASRETTSFSGLITRRHLRPACLATPGEYGSHESCCLRIEAARFPPRSLQSFPVPFSLPSITPSPPQWLRPLSRTRLPPPSRSRPRRRRPRPPRAPNPPLPPPPRAKSPARLPAMLRRKMARTPTSGTSRSESAISPGSHLPQPQLTIKLGTSAMSTRRL